MTWHGYFAIEDLALTAPQRAAIITALRGLGPASDPQPAHLMQFRPRLDGKAAIFEALFNDTHLTVQSVKQFLADAVGISAAIISDTVQQTARGPLITYSVGGVERLRYLVFGGLGATWNESRVQCIAYLLAHLAEWETELE